MDLPDRFNSPFRSCRGGLPPQHRCRAHKVVRDDASGKHDYALIAVGPQGAQTEISSPAQAGGLATLEWDSTTGADAYIVVRDGKPITDPLRIEGSRKNWTDTGKN